ncbi:MAG TPA: hypothetical protein VF884_00360 [Nitrososphaeraceae archaeon]
MNKTHTISKMDEEIKNDSIRQLRLLRLHGGKITRSSTKVSELSNGLPYFFVELTCEDGRQMGIPAYGDEAIALCAETLNLLEPCVMVRSR